MYYNFMNGLFVSLEMAMSCWMIITFFPVIISIDMSSKIKLVKNPVNIENFYIWKCVLIKLVSCDSLHAVSNYSDA